MFLFDCTKSSMSHLDASIHLLYLTYISVLNQNKAQDSGMSRCSGGGCLTQMNRSTFGFPLNQSVLGNHAVGIKGNTKSTSTQFHWLSRLCFSPQLNGKSSQTITLNPTAIKSNAQFHLCL